MWRMSANGSDPARPTWMPAQLTIDARTSFRIMLEGQANNGGFAVDDIKILPGTCKSESVHIFFLDYSLINDYFVIIVVRSDGFCIFFFNTRV